MPKEFGRNRRIAQFIKEKLAVLIQREFPLDRHGMITLTNVDVSPDFKNATVYVTSLGKVQSHDELIAKLNEKTRYFRYEISQVMTSKGVPTLKFKYDESIGRARRLTEIIESVSQENSGDR